MSANGSTRVRTGFGMSSSGPFPDDDATGEDPPLLASNATVDLAAERKAAGIDEILASLDRQLIGMEPVKHRLREIASLVLVDQARARFGLASPRPNLHMSFTGNPGTGKTTVALRLAELLQRLGCLEHGHLVAATRDDLVGQYVGHTAPKTKEVLRRAMGGVLFIDEAYNLFRADNSRDYGQEAIEMLLQVMENQRQDIVVVLAGYRDHMDEFFGSNPGMSSRIAHHLHFDDYGVDQLTAIADIMVADQHYELSPAGRRTFREYLERRSHLPRFANARSVRNAIERARLRQAHRLLSAERRSSREDLKRLEPADFLASRVFAAVDTPSPS